MNTVLKDLNANPGSRCRRLVILAMTTLLACAALTLTVPGTAVAQTVTATIPVDDYPTGVGVNPVTNRIYVANYNSNSVSVIDGDSGTVISTIPVGTSPYCASVDSVTNRIYVTNWTDGTVSVIDGDLGTVISTITVGSSPYFIAINTATNRIYVTNTYSNNVSVIDRLTYTVIATVAVGTSPFGICADPVTDRIYVANADSDDVYVIDGATNTLIGSPITVGDRPIGIDAIPSTNKIYVACTNSNTVSVIDGSTGTVAGTIPAGNFSMAVGANIFANKIYVANPSAASVTVIDGSTGTVAETVAVGNTPGGVGVNPCNAMVYVANRADDTVSVIYDPPVPVITGLSPDRKIAGEGSFTLTVNGTGFIDSSVARWNGSDLATTYVSDTQLTATIPAASIAAAGTVAVTVFNPDPGGHESNVQDFTVGTLSVNASALGGHGTVSPATQELNYGGTATIILTPDENCHVGSVTDNGTRVDPTPTGTYTIENVTSDHDVVVTYVLEVYDWYLAEGATDGGMETWVLVQNPNDTAVTVDLTLMTENGPTNPAALQGVAVPADSRASFNLGAQVTTYHVSTMVNSTGGDVVCERAMYGADRAWATDSVGATALSNTWYLAEGATDGGMETWVLVQNPNPNEVFIDVTFMTSSGPVAGPRDYRIPPESRHTFKVEEMVTDYEISTMITASGGGIICERSMYGNGRTWAHDSIGAASPSPTWYLAEGCTDGGMETFLLVQNPNVNPVTLDLILMTSSGEQEPVHLALHGYSRQSLRLNDYVTDYDVSAFITSTGAGGSVICERSMYNLERTWGTDSVGVVTPAATWYLAEGSTGGGMTTWVLVQNPMNVEVSVDITYMTSNGPVAGPQDVVIAANSRRSFNVGETVIDYNVSTLVKATGGVVCERSMYGGDSTWAHSSIGYAP